MSWLPARLVEGEQRQPFPTGHVALVSHSPHHSAISTYIFILNAFSAGLCSSLDVDPEEEDRHKEGHRNAGQGNLPGSRVGRGCWPHGTHALIVSFCMLGLGSACPIPGGMPGETPLWFYKATGSWTHGSFPWGEGRDCRVENYLDLRWQSCRRICIQDNLCCPIQHPPAIHGHQAHKVWVVRTEMG